MITIFNEQLNIVTKLDTTHSKLTSSTVIALTTQLSPNPTFLKWWQSKIFSNIYGSWFSVTLLQAIVNTFSTTNQFSGKFSGSGLYIHEMHFLTNTNRKKHLMNPISTWYNDTQYKLSFVIIITALNTEIVKLIQYCYWQSYAKKIKILNKNSNGTQWEST